MNSTNKPKINVLLVGLSGVGKTSLCQAFGGNYIEGFSYGFGLSKKAQIVEFITDKCTYHIIDAPHIYDPQDEINTQNHANEISRILKLSCTPCVICFVIRIQEHDMLVKSSDYIMMKTIARYYNQGQVKFSLIINRLTENEFSIISNNSQYRGKFLKSFERNGGIPITDDDILLIHNKFLSYTPQDQKQLLTSYLRKFEAGHISEFEQMMKKINEANHFPQDAFMYGYNTSMQKYENEFKNIMQGIEQRQQEQQQQNLQVFQQIMGGSSSNMFSTPNIFGGSPYQQQQPNPYSQYMSGLAPQSPIPSNPYLGSNVMNQYIQQVTASSNALTNAYLSQYLGSNNSTAFGATNGVNQQTPNNNTNNDIFGAAGAFVGGAMGVPGMSSGSNNDLYGAAGSFVGGAVTAGCTIM